RRCRAGLALKALERRFVTRNVVGKEFQRDPAPQPRILGRVDHAHAAAAKLLCDAIVRHRLADHVASMIYVPGRRPGWWKPLCYTGNSRTVRCARSSVG